MIIKLSEIVFFTFPGKILCGGKTGEYVQRKRKRSRKYIHPYQRQISEKYTNQFSKLHCLNSIAFYSKSCQIKNISKPHSGAFNLVVMNGPKR